MFEELQQWISVSKMKLNLSKSSIMWFSIKPSPIETPPIVVKNAAPAVVSRQRYLGVIFDSQLRWTHHVLRCVQNYVLLFNDD